MIFGVVLNNVDLQTTDSYYGTQKYYKESSIEADAA